MVARNSPLLRILKLFNINVFLRWWGAGLAACLPQSLRRLFTPSTRQIIADISDAGTGELLLIDQRGNKSKELGRYSLAAIADGSLRGQLPNLKDKQVVLYLGSHQALSKELPLPQAAEANLRRVIGFELDRLTPFTANKIYYDAQISGRQADTRLLLVRFTMVLRSLLDPLLQQLASVDLLPDVVTLSGDNYGTNLLPVTQRPRKGRFARRLRWLLLTLLLVSAMAAAALPLWQQRNVVVTLIPQAHQVQQQAEVVFALRKNLEDSVASSRFLLEKRKVQPLAMDILNELTALLPDHTWVEQLHIRNGEVQVRGLSQEASKLIALLDGSDFFQGVTFRSPVSRDNRTGQDRFFLVATIVSPSQRTAVVADAEAVSQ